ncbi:unnamed protein product, partial [Mesorhabditis belari]|uniref:MOSC domain-containing protein n=1 Tax=Mesorhabditis belari TaxID=2138241 RepID=A0AAF3EPM6_9BILA
MPPISKDDAVLLATCIGGSMASYHALRLLVDYFRPSAEWIPIGKIKELYIFPLKSGKGKPVFSLYCNQTGCVEKENQDRMFMVTDPNGHFFTGRVKPMLTQILIDVFDGVAHLSYGDDKMEFLIKDVIEQNKVLQATMFFEKRHDGLDCGEAAAKFITKIVGETARLVLYTSDLFNGRVLTSNPKWWNNNPVPHRVTKQAYTNLTPHMLSTQGSLDELNDFSKRTGGELLTNVQFRANIVIEGCPAWDEDKWDTLRFGPLPIKGSTEIQCMKPCERCVEIDVDPKTGLKMKEAPPLAKLKEFRMPVGNMLESLGRHPIFGVQAAQNTDGFVHVGMTVWAKYKPSAF